jgi:Rieske Fe-S protein
MLIGAGAVTGVVAAGGLGACGGASSRPPGKGTSSGGPLARTSDIPVGGGKIFADQETVITQPAAGTFHAFTAICTHMGCTVGTVANGLITCPCHGSEYSITDGSVKRGPAPSPLATKRLTVNGGEITVTG